MDNRFHKCDQFLVQYLQEQDDLQKKIRLLVQFKNNEEIEVKSFLVSCGCQVDKLYENINTFLIETSLNYITELIKNDSILKINLDREAWLLLDIAVPSIGINRLIQNDKAPILTGKGVNVAIIDTGVHPHPDLTEPKNRIISFYDLVNGKIDPYDDNGHGTHVAGCIASNGFLSNGTYQGCAPEVNIIAIKAMDALGRGTISTIIEGVQWVIANKDKYNIKILSLSIGSLPLISYKTDPLCLILEEAWNNGIVVLVAAGNEGPKSSTISSPGIHPVLITVDASDDKNTSDISDDTVASFSSRGPTLEGLDKPDFVAPGTNIVSLISPGSYSDKLKPQNKINENYFQMSGTSMATPIAAGLTALILEKNNELTPIQIKNILCEGAIPISEDKLAVDKGIINFHHSIHLTTI